ncbi:MAG: hypothetical protein ACOZBH_00920 [Patescibacteria group bacterium]
MKRLARIMTREQFEAFEGKDEGRHELEDDCFAILADDNPRARKVAYVKVITCNLVIIIVNVTQRRIVIGNYLDASLIDFGELVSHFFGHSKRTRKDDIQVFLIGHSDEDINEGEVLDEHWRNMAQVLRQLASQRIYFSEIRWLRPDEGEHLSVYVDVTKGISIFQSEFEPMRQWAFWEEFCGPVTQDEMRAAGVSNTQVEPD